METGSIRRCGGSTKMGQCQEARMMHGARALLLKNHRAIAMVERQSYLATGALRSIVVRETL